MQNIDKYKEIKNLAEKSLIKLKIDESDIDKPFIIKGERYSEYETKRLCHGIIDGWLYTGDVKRLIN